MVLEIDNPIKKCLNCGKEITFQSWVDSLPRRIAKGGEKQLIGFWEYKLYCDKKCRVEFKSRVDLRYEKVCIHCGKKYHKKGAESTPGFDRRKFCGNGCKKEYFLIEQLARMMGIEHDILKNHILKLIPN